MRTLRLVAPALAIGLAACAPSIPCGGVPNASPSPGPTQSTGPTLTEGSAVPNVTFKDTAGQSHKLSEFKGKALAVSLFATWCPHCQVDLPKIQAWIDKTPGVTFLPVESSGGTAQQVLDFKIRYNIKADAFLDLSESDFRLLGGQGFPTNLLIGKQGGIVDVALGVPPLERWSAYLGGIEASPGIQTQ